MPVNQKSAMKISLQKPISQEQEGKDGAHMVGYVHTSRQPAPLRAGHPVACGCQGAAHTAFGDAVSVPLCFSLWLSLPVSAFLSLTLSLSLSVSLFLPLSLPQVTCNQSWPRGGGGGNAQRRGGCAWWADGTFPSETVPVWVGGPDSLGMGLRLELLPGL